MNDIVIVGMGGHGREVLSIIGAVNAVADGPIWRPVGFVDDKPSAANRERVDRLGLTCLGPVDWLADLPPTTHVAVAVADPDARARVVNRIAPFARPYASLVHPLAMLGPDTVTAEGLVVFAGARVTTNVALGRHVHINQNATIGHDCVLGDFVTVNPLAAVSGECHLEAGVLVGTTAAILQGRRVGAGSTVGAGACVVKDVPPGVVVKGVPAI
jgi:sugar O-acyltransferase (sialic acid O-acetyltransferase NeuD family)